MAKETIPVLEANQDALNAVDFVRQYGSQVKTLLGAPTQQPYVQGLRPPIIATLLQPVSSCEEALAVIMEPSTSVNTHRFDMYGYFNELTTNFQFKIIAYEYSVGPDGNVPVAGSGRIIGMTELLTAKDCDAKMMFDAILATGICAPFELDVTVGNYFKSKSLVNNEALRWSRWGRTPTVTWQTRQEDLFCHIGQWYVELKGAQWDNRIIYFRGANVNNSEFNDTFGNNFNAVVCYRTGMRPAGVTTIVRDVGNTPVTGPLVAGTPVLCIDVPGFGYSISSAFPREFFA